MKYTVEVYPSGSTVITDGNAALYVHTCRELVEKGEPLTDTERYQIASEVADRLNSVTNVETTIGQRLKALRHQNGMKLVDLSDKTCLSVSYLSDIERGRTMPSLETCMKLAATHRITLAQLFHGIG